MFAFLPSLTFHIQLDTKSTLEMSFKLSPSYLSLLLLFIPFVTYNNVNSLFGSLTFSLYTLLQSDVSKIHVESCCSPD